MVELIKDVVESDVWEVMKNALCCRLLINDVEKLTCSTTWTEAGFLPPDIILVYENLQGQGIKIKPEEVVEEDGCHIPTIFKLANIISYKLEERRKKLVA